MSKLALELVENCIETQDTDLDLGNCGLADVDFLENSALSEALKKCSHLKKLVLSNSWWDYETSAEIKSANKGPRNYFTECPAAVIYLKELTEIIISGYFSAKWGILDMSFVANLPNLRSLIINQNEIKEITGLEKLTSLKKLDLSDNKIEKIQGLENLIELEQLYLSWNQIQELQGLQKLKSLRFFFIWENKIRNIKGLENLKALNTIYLSTNQIKEIRGLENLTALKNLYLHKNRIQEIQGLENLISLEKLSLSFNKIKEIKGLENLTSLKQLHVNSNQIKNLKGFSKIQGLKKIDLSDNNINDITPIIPYLKNSKSQLDIVFKEAGDLQLGEVNLLNIPLTIPPIEIAKQGNKMVLNYFSELGKQGIEYLYEAKMLIVGQPRAGKTSLRYKLFNSSAQLPEEDKTTRGIDIKRLEFDIIDREKKPRKFFYNVWDFGGQQIYQTTHQFFLTHRSLYILVMDTGKDSIGNDDNTVNYWLQALELLGGNSPLLLVRNEKNERQVYIDFPQKQARFNFLKKDYNLDLNALIPETPSFNVIQLSKFSILKEDIETELKRLPLVGFPMPKNWVEIRNELQKLSTSRHYITRQEFIGICKLFDVNEFARQMELSNIFHDLGVFLHFQEYNTLEDFIILQNAWATDAVFAVFDNPNVQANKGKFSDSDLSLIWKDEKYEASVHKKLLALMMQFELCYQVDKSNPNSYIIPEMLSDSPPEGFKWQESNDLPLQYRYDFMPKGILTRLIVRLHKYIDTYKGQQTVWKTGVKIDGTSLDCLNTIVEITEAWNNKQLSIRAQGPFAKDLMSKITYQIDELNSEFFRQVSISDKSQKSKWYKMIPCNCDSCKNSADKHFYDYRELLERKEYGKQTIECKKKPFANVDISELIDGVFAREIDNFKIKKGVTSKSVNIFISYSSKDRDLRELLVDGIKENLENKRISYTIWTDTEIDTGANWKEEIEKALKNSVVAVLLVSAGFAASKFIKENELTEFFKRKSEEGYLILPVLIRNYNFSEFEKLSSLNFFKTYYNEYGFNKPTVRNKLMPFDVLGDDENVTNKQLQDYYRNLSDHINDAVTNYLKTLIH